ncbi:MAG TPA: hypothetical protein VF086_11715 [Propionibacteriaceae bacterium]
MTAHLQDLQRSFLRHLRAERRSPSTLRLYAQAVPFLSRWLEAQGCTATLDELNRAAIREWLAVLSDTREPGTVKIRYRRLFRFCSWLVDDFELSSNPMATMSPPTLKMKPVPVVTADDLVALLKACNGKEFSDRRDEALIRLLLDVLTTSTLTRAWRSSKAKAPGSNGLCQCPHHECCDHHLDPGPRRAAESGRRF